MRWTGQLPVISRSLLRCSWGSSPAMERWRCPFQSGPPFRTSHRSQGILGEDPGVGDAGLDTFKRIVMPLGVHLDSHIRACSKRGHEQLLRVGPQVISADVGWFVGVCCRSYFAWVPVAATVKISFLANFQIADHPRRNARQGGVMGRVHKLWRGWSPSWSHQLCVV